MSATKSYAVARVAQPGEIWKKFIEHPNRWILTVDGKEFPVGTDFSIKSRFGEVRSAVVMNPDGTPAFDRPQYIETPFTQAVIWGRGKDGRYYYGMIEQERPHADLSGQENLGVDGHEPVRFLHVVMGFSEKAATAKFETVESTARREALEEGGVGESAIVGIEIYTPGHNPTPTYTSTWGRVAAIEINLQRIGKPIPSQDEPINGVYFIEGNELLKMIRKGTSDEGAYTGGCTSLSALLIHWAHHPEQFPHVR